MDSSGAIHATATNPIGEHCCGQRHDDASAHDRSCVSDTGVADPKVVCSELCGLREQGVDEGRAHRRCGQQTHHLYLRSVEPIGR
jgi:hypothetical protein